MILDEYVKADHCLSRNNCHSGVVNMGLDSVPSEKEVESGGPAKGVELGVNGPDDWTVEIGAVETSR